MGFPFWGKSRAISEKLLFPVSSSHSSETREEKRERDRKKKSENKPWELRTRVEFSSQKEITSVFNIDLRVSSNTLLLCRAKVVGNKLAIDRGIENRDPRGWKDRGGGGKKRDRTGGY